MATGALVKKCLSEAFEIVGKNLLPLFMAVALILIPLWAVDFFCVEKICDLAEIETHFEEYSKTVSDDGSEDAVPANIRQDLRKLFFYLLLKMVLNIMQLLLVCCAVILTKRTKDTQRRINVMEVMEDSAFSYPKTALSYLVMMILTVFGLFFFIFPGIIIYLGLMFTVTATALRRKVAVSIQDSIRIFRENTGASLLIFLLSFIVPVGFDFILGMALGLMTEYEIIYAIISCIFFLISGMVSCFGYVLAAVFYLDRTTLPFEEKKPDKQAS